SPEIMADAAVEIITSPGSKVNGGCLIDSEVLRAAGVEDLSRYGGGDKPIIDIFVDR
ncbi:MAG: short chain dehydrogenase, partial [Mycolicibacterium aromaticivorans]|nr:short chain dehydrogenase [Mycolicibacterium aromaticivorans]